MYPTSKRDQIVYPSTLDLYALATVYQGSFLSSPVQLPTSITYKMLVGTGTVLSNSAPTFIELWKALYRYIFAVIALTIVVVVLVLSFFSQRRNRFSPSQTVYPATRKP